MTEKASPSPLAHSGHRARVRQRLERDATALADYEVLELLLGYGLTRKDTKPLAKALLQRFGNIRAVMDAREEDLQEVQGIGKGLLAFWKVLQEAHRRYMASQVQKRTVLADPASVAQMAQARLAGCPHEECWLVLVDQGNRLMAWERLRHGGVTSVFLEPRDVFERALLRKASGIILVHNHPGGNPEPSPADQKLTGELQALAPRMGLRFLDHIIVTDKDCYSMTRSQRI